MSLASETGEADAQATVNVKGLLVVFYPELVAAALKHKEGDLYIVWSALRALDQASPAHKGSGHWRVSAVLAVIESLLGIGPAQAYVKLKKGVGRYWNAPKGRKGARATSLIGMGPLVRQLAPNMPAVAPFAYRMDALLRAPEDYGWSDLRELLTIMVAARYQDNRPVTIASIREHTGLSRSTIKRNLHSPLWNSLATIANLVRVFSSKDRQEVVDVFSRIYTDNPKEIYGKWRVVWSEGEYHLVKQLANTYRLRDATRLDLRARPRELRNECSQNWLNTPARRFVTDNAQMSRPGVATMDRTWFVPVGTMGMDKLGRVNIWTPNGKPMLPEEWTAKPERLNLSDRWEQFVLTVGAQEAASG